MKKDGACETHVSAWKRYKVLLKPKKKKRLNEGQDKYPLSVRKGARFCEKTVELSQLCMDLVFIAPKQFVVKF